MRLLYFAPPFNTAARTLYDQLGALEGTHDNQYIASINMLIDHLRTPMGLATICILWPATYEELQKLSEMRYLLRDLRVILILPDRQSRTLSDAHLLRPRFVSYADGELNEVTEVAKKIIDSQQHYPILQTAT
jgi:hypothetical protein